MARAKKNPPKVKVELFYHYFELPKDLQREIWRQIQITKRNFMSFAFLSKKMYPHILEFADVSKIQVPLLHSAISRGNKDNFMLLLQNPSVDIACGCKNTTYENVSSFGIENNYACCLAAKHANIEFLEILLQQPRVDPSADDNYPLCHAAVNGHLTMLKMLMANPLVDPSAQENHSIKIAAARGHTAIVETLLKDKRVDPSGETFITVCRFGNVEIVKMLLADSRVDPCVEECRGLMDACKNGHVEVVKLLLQDGRVNPSVADNQALKNATRYGHALIVNILKEDPRIDKNIVIK